MTQIGYSIPISSTTNPISSTTKMHGTAEMESWYMTVGKWIVEVQDGNLIVRGLSSPEVLLTVKA